MLLVLEELLPTARIHAQVAMGALLRAPPAPGRRTLSSDRNYFSQKIVDFVIQDRASGAIRALIEVDDRFHSTHKDTLRDAVTSAAGYRTIRISGATPATLQHVRPVIVPLIDLTPC